MISQLYEMHIGVANWNSIENRTTCLEVLVIEFFNQKFRHIYVWTQFCLRFNIVSNGRVMPATNYYSTDIGC